MFAITGGRQNTVDMFLTAFMRTGSNQTTSSADKIESRITKGREQIINKTFVKMMDELAMAELRAGICGGEHIEKWNKTRSEQHSSDRGI